MEKENEKIKNKVRILSVKWNENLIGYLMKEYDVGYLFKYDKNAVKAAKEKGFVSIPGLPYINKTYTSKELFQVFKARIPSKQRRNLPEILQKIGIDGTGPDKRDFDDFDYLAKTHAVTLTDFISVDEDINILKSRKKYFKANALDKLEKEMF